MCCFLKFNIYIKLKSVGDTCCILHFCSLELSRFRKKKIRRVEIYSQKLFYTNEDFFLFLKKIGFMGAGEMAQ